MTIAESVCRQFEHLIMTNPPDLRKYWKDARLLATRESLEKQWPAVKGRRPVTRNVVLTFEDGSQLRATQYVSGNSVEWADATTVP